MQPPPNNNTAPPATNYFQTNVPEKFENDSNTEQSIEQNEILAPVISEMPELYKNQSSAFNTFQMNHHPKTRGGFQSGENSNVESQSPYKDDSIEMYDLPEAPPPLEEEEEEKEKEVENNQNLMLDLLHLWNS